MMKNKTLIKYNDEIFRILDIRETRAFVINCNKKSMPRWVDIDTLSCFLLCSDDDFCSLEDINDMSMSSRKCAYERFTMISGVLPFITDKYKRCSVIKQISAEKGVSTQTINNYLWLYLAYQNISALAPKEKADKRELTDFEKNIRWALNKYYYTRHQNTLNTVYTLMLKEKYCDENGYLLEQYPSFYQFRYFYRQHRKMQNYYISRGGVKNYQRNNRPLLGDGVQEFAHSVGFGMLDSTICDIYLINDSGGLVGRPILTVCVDGYSGLCCGYSLSWEGGVYSLRSLMLNVIADKKEWCKKFGIDINTADWNCDKLPATIITDMGKEYVSETFEQIADLGITVVNLPPYRPELKGVVEKFFDVVQSLYKPHLKDKGVIEPDFQERGIKDYRKDACLTMADFEKIILYCIIHYNTKRLIEDFPYTENMIAENVKPYANCIWNYEIEQIGANLITTDYDTLVLTLLPRVTGKFTRKGLIVNGLRYKNDNYTEQYLSGGIVTVAYNPENVSDIWLIESGNYIKFSLIESRFQNKDMSGVSDIRAKQQMLESAERTAVLQAKIDLVNHISAITETATHQNGTSIKGIRQNRQREERKTHIDFLRWGADNE